MSRLSEFSLLGVLLIISTKPYTEAELRLIVDIRCEEEDVEMADDAKELLTKIGHETSLRYALHLITSAALVCKQRKGAEVEIEDVSKVYSLFLDVKRSTQFLVEYQSQYMYNEIGAVAGAGVYGIGGEEAAPMDG